MNTLLISYEKAWTQIIRMEGECGAELSSKHGSTKSLRERARRLIECANPPIGEDLEFCYRIIGGNIIAG
jgi:hypothetical protein